MKSSDLVVVFLSDLHVGREVDDDTWVKVGSGASSRGENPLEDLFALGKSGELTADWVVFGGDLSNRSFSSAKTWGWKKLHELTLMLKASKLVATPGNHDVNVSEHGVPVHDDLKRLEPKFPTDDADLRESFWRNGYYIDDSHPVVRILNINSCFDFPEPPSSASTADQIDLHRRQTSIGSISVERIESIAASLSQRSERLVNIALVHHHPFEHELRAKFRDYHGPMAGGGEFLQMLDEVSDSGRWLILHGHKHLPGTALSGTNSRSPFVFCAGSVGGALWPPVNTVYRNMFHVLNFHLSADPALPALRGTVTSYEWGIGNGWRVANDDEPFAGRFGFGVIEDPAVTAARMAQHLNEYGAMRWSAVLSEWPTLQFISRRDQVALARELAKLGWEIGRRYDGTLDKITERIADV